jgi:hypothetical protein
VGACLLQATVKRTARDRTQAGVKSFIVEPPFLRHRMQVGAAKYSFAMGGSEHIA